MCLCISILYGINHQPNATFSQFEPADSTVRYNGTIHVTSIDKLILVIKSRNNKKSTGIDNIPNIVIRKLSKQFVASLATLLNQMYNIGYFPKAWKNAKITPIQKPQKLHLTQIVIDRFCSYERSTVHPLVILQKDIVKNCMARTPKILVLILITNKYYQKIR